EENVWVGGTGIRAGAGGVSGGSGEAGGADAAPAANEKSDVRAANLPMKRPSVVPDGHGALLIRGPRLERRIQLSSAPIATTLDRFGSELTIGSLALLTLGLLAAAFVAHRATRP